VKTFTLEAGGQVKQRNCSSWTRARPEWAFTLIEVMIACGIFFIAIFAILSLVASTLRNARVLRRVEVDAGMIAAQLFKTNRLNVGTESGDFGEAFPDYSWQTSIDEAFPFTNGLWQVDIIVRRRGFADPVDAISVWVYSPDSKRKP
jgi:type II secretory pathway pseudopilin PulG